MNFGRSVLNAVVVFAIATSVWISDSHAAGTVSSTVLDGIRERGFVRCGVRNNLTGFSVVDRNGKWTGLSVDFCAALAAAVLGSDSAVKYLPLVNVRQYSALVDGDVDIVVGGDAWTLSRDTELGVRFVGTLFHDGQVFLVRRDQAVASALELSGTKVCALDGTRAVQGLERFFGTRQMRYTLVLKTKWRDAVDTYQEGNCNVLTGDLSLLASERLTLSQPNAHQVLREVVSKVPLGPVVKMGDDVWFSIVRWTLMALLEAEELGITRENVREFETTKNSRVRQLLGLGTNLGAGMGLTRDWAFNAISKVGNYAELFDRHVGKDSPLQMSRGLNALWTQGGLMYGAPLR